MDKRKQQLTDWLKATIEVPDVILKPISGDASFRRYFRFKHLGYSYVAMDAPPAQENNPAFVAVSRALSNQGVRVPLVYHHNFEHGFLMIEDFGDHVLLDQLNAVNAEGNYQLAFDQLLNIQS